MRHRHRHTSIAACAAALLLFAGQHARAAKGIPIKIGSGAYGFHVPVELMGKTLIGEMPDEHMIFFVEDALKAFKGAPDILVLSSKRLKNGLALISKGRKGEDVRLILFDEDELEQFQKSKRNTALDRLNLSIVLLSLAHEIGHHVCGHLVQSTLSRWNEELEADRAAGAILAKSPWLDYFTARPTLESFIEAGRKVLGDDVGSETHPPLERRIEAIRTGWSNGLACAAAKATGAKSKNTGK